MTSKVLIVEDEFLIALALEDAVRDCGFDIMGPLLSKAECDNLTEQRITRLWTSISGMVLPARKLGRP
jgi:hypothetical protein